MREPRAPAVRPARRKKPPVPEPSLDERIRAAIEREADPRVRAWLEALLAGNNVTEDEKNFNPTRP